MDLKRTAAIVLGGGALAAWLAGAATSSSHGVAEPIEFRPSPLDARGSELASEIARLHERLTPSASPRQPGRNLFTFRAAAARAAAPNVDPVPPALTDAPAALPLPTLKLAGIAEDPGPEGPMRTAIISGDGQLFMAKEGDAVTPRYRVTRISVDVVELIDLGDGSFRRLAFK